MTIDTRGERNIEILSPETYSLDGTEMTFELPNDVCTGWAYLWDDYAGTKQWLQIVPWVKGYSALTGKYNGSGFIEGDMTAVVGESEYIDGGVEADDGIDVSSSNRMFSLTSPFDETQSVYAITEGGTSNTFTP